jgi:hypothetical protein
MIKFVGQNQIVTNRPLAVGDTITLVLRNCPFTYKVVEILRTEGNRITAQVRSVPFEPARITDTTAQRKNQGIGIVGGVAAPQMATNRRTS